MRVGYRVRQFWRTISAEPLSPDQLEEIQTILTPEAYRLFLNYDQTDRQHCFRVMRSLVESGDDNHDLLVAALLHDVGKTQVPLTSLDRVLGTIAEKSMSDRAVQWGQAEPEGWHRPFAVRTQHAEWGALLAEQAGCSPATVDLIRHHQDKNFNGTSPENLYLLQRLQWADEQN